LSCGREDRNNERRVKTGAKRGREAEAGRSGREINGEQSQDHKMSKCGDRISISRGDEREGRTGDGGK